MGGSGGEGSMMNCEGARVKVKELWGRVEEGKGQCRRQEAVFVKGWAVVSRDGEE